MVLPVSHRAYRGVAKDGFKVSCPLDRKTTVVMAIIAQGLTRVDNLKVTQEATL